MTKNETIKELQKSNREQLKLLKALRLELRLIGHNCEQVEAEFESMTPKAIRSKMRHMARNAECIVTNWF